MFQLYLLLRLKNFGRIVIELGIFRIVFLTILTVAAIMILFLAENRFAIPVVCVLLLAGYHNVRKDKEFLRTLTPHLSVFLIKEYTLIVLPFAGIEIIKGPVSYTHLDVYKRQGYHPPSGIRNTGQTSGDSPPAGETEPQ